MRPEIPVAALSLGMSADRRSLSVRSIARKAALGNDYPSRPESVRVGVPCHMSTSGGSAIGRSRRDSAERERKGAKPCIEKLDFELPIDYGSRLSNQLIHPGLDNDAVAFLVNVHTVSGTRRLSVERDAEPHRLVWRCRSHDEMKITGVKAVCNAPIRPVRRDCLPAQYPITGKCPVIEA